MAEMRSRSGTETSGHWKTAATAARATTAMSAPIRRNRSASVVQREEFEEIVAGGQKKAFMAWVNTHLAKREMSISDLSTDLHDGLALVNLVEILTNKSVGAYNKRPKNPIQQMENINIALKAMNDNGVKTSCTGELISAGETKFLLGMLWQVIRKFQLKANENATASGLKTDLLLWLRRQIGKYPGVKCENFTTNFIDGLAFSALVHSLQADALDFAAVRPQNSTENLTRAFALAKELFDIPSLLDPVDVAGGPDELSIMTYVSYFRAYSQSRPVVAGPPVDEATQTDEEWVPERAQAELNTLQSARDEASKQRDDLKRQLTDAQAQASKVAELEAAVASRDRQLEQQSKLGGDKTSQLAAANEALREERTSKATLALSLDQSKTAERQANAATEAWRKQCEDAQSQLDNSRRELSSLQDKYLTLDARHSALVESHGGAQRSNDELREDAAAAKQNVKNLEHQLASLSTSLLEKDATVARLNQAAETRQQEAVALQNALDAERLRAQDLDARLTAANTDKAALTTQLEDNKREAAEAARTAGFQSQVELKKLREEMQAGIARKDEELAAAKADLAEEKAAGERKQQALESAEQSGASTRATLLREREDTAATIESLRQESADALDAKVAAEQRASETDRYRAEARLLREQLLESQEAHRKAVDAHDALILETDGLRAQAAVDKELTGRMYSYQSELVKKRNELKKEHEDAERLRLLLWNKEKIIADMQKQHAHAYSTNVSSELNEVQTQLRAALLKIEEMKSSQATTEQENIELRSHNSEATTELSLVHRQISHQKREIDGVRDQMVDKDEQLAHLRSDVLERDQDVRALREEVATLRSKIQWIDDEKNAMANTETTQVGMLMKQIVALETRIDEMATEQEVFEKEAERWRTMYEKLHAEVSERLLKTHSPVATQTDGDANAGISRILSPISRRETLGTFVSLDSPYMRADFLAPLDSSALPAAAPPRAASPHNTSNHASAPTSRPSTRPSSAGHSPEHGSHHDTGRGNVTARRHSGGNTEHNGRPRSPERRRSGTSKPDDVRKDMWQRQYFWWQKSVV